MDTLYPAERHRRPRIPAPATPAPPVTDPDAARAWLDAERATLVAVAAHAAEHGWPGHATRLAATLFRYLDTAGHYAEAVTIHTNARRAARAHRRPGRRGHRADQPRPRRPAAGPLPAGRGHLQQALACSGRPATGRRRPAR